ncbi:MAG: GNAT family N-acetyltransferase [Roseiflexaceae bacterium]
MTTIIQELASAESVVAQEQNLYAFWSLYGRAPGRTIEDGAALLRIQTGIPVPIMNAVFRTRLEPDQVGETIGTVRDAFAAQALPFLWWCGPSDRPAGLGAQLVAQGFHGDSPLPMMAIDLETLGEEGPLPPGTTIGLVDDEATLRAWCDIISVSFGFPPEVHDDFFALETSLGIGEVPGQYRYVARQNGVPVACSTLLLAAGVAGIYTVAVEPSARRQGLGAAITLAPLYDARRQGYRIGTLQATAMGQPVYRRIGFHDIAPFDCYAWIP